LSHWQDCHIVYVTDGAPRNSLDTAASGFGTREGYRVTRNAEALAALALAGVPARRVHGLGIADQEAAFQLTKIAHSLAALLRKLQPAVVVTHPYEGGHPDHDATAFAVRSASVLCGLAGVPEPAVIEMTSYHSRSGRIQTGEFLPAEMIWGKSEVKTLELSAKERALKQAMLRCHQTQAATLQYFSTERERFRIAPNYEFTRPPHEGKLFYENFNWGMTADRWCELASRALSGLAMEVQL
jgi:LmbE family N-acetylglucosaminyl deacetylase